VESINHADLGVWRATSNNQRQNGKLVDFVLAQSIELSSSHNHGARDVGTDPVHVLGKNADLNGDGLGGLGMIASKHVHRDASFMANANGTGRRGPGRVI